jgi:hypothetical protein
MFARLSAALLIPASSAWAGAIGYSFKNVVLVKGEVQSIGQAVPNRATPCVVKVLHVYCGDAAHKGKVFTDLSGPVEGSDVRPSIPALEVGEEGLWRLHQEGDGLRIAVGGEFGFFIRARKKHTPRYKELLAVAEAAERACATAPEEQVGLFRRLARDKVPEVSAFAVAFGLGLDNGRGETLLAEWLTDKDLPIGAQVRFDELRSDGLTAALAPEEVPRRQAWLASPVRAARMRDWVEAKLDEYLADAVLRRLARETVREQLEPKTYFQLFRRLLNNPHASVKHEAVERVVVYLLNVAAADAPVNSAGEAFSFLVDVVGMKIDKEFREAAAWGLTGLASVTAEQLAVLLKLREAEKDKDVARRLDEAIAKFKGS